MRRALFLFTAVALVSCGGDDDQLSDAFCADLESGLSAGQIYGGVRNQYEPEEFAGLAFGFASIDCPEQLDENEGFRVYLEGWGINPDSQD